MKYIQQFEIKEPNLGSNKYILCVHSNVSYYTAGMMYKIKKEGTYGAWHYSRKIEDNNGRIHHLLTNKPETDYLEMYGSNSETLAIFTTKITWEEYELENDTKKYNL